MAGVPDKENEVPLEIDTNMDEEMPLGSELEDENNYAMGMDMVVPDAEYHPSVQDHILAAHNDLADVEYHPTIQDHNEAVSAAQQNAMNEHVQDEPSTDYDDPDDLYKPDGTIYLDIDCFMDFCRGTPDVQQRLSKPVFVRGLPWKILAIPRISTVSYEDQQGRVSNRNSRALGFFLQCNGDSETSSWNCIATATLKVLSQFDNIEDHSRRISHTFYPKENDWGYSQFLTCDHLANPEHGFIKNDTIRLVVHVAADAPHGVSWDSKKHAGHIGLKNQGATCYMNSILQTLFFTNRLRRAVYEMPTLDDVADNNVALAMQRVFYDLQHSDRPVGTKKLTKSFGWDSLETFMQHDVQELCRVLLDNLETKMKGCVVEDTIPNLFRGRTKSYITCTNVDFESNREEAFYDIQLNVKGKNNIMESFREYIEVESLDGENKYDAGNMGLQPAEKGVKFVMFPPVLHLQLMRFQYDPQQDANVKINDRFEFPDRLNLNEFIEDGGEDEDYTYALQSVLVHSGDFHGGHYVVFINTNLTNPGPDGKMKPRWCKFDDEVVSRATVKDAIMANYGGEDGETPGRTYTNAYMLVYVKLSSLNEVLCPLTDEDIPRHLRDRFECERTEEIRRKKEKQEAHLYTEIQLLTESTMLRHHGFDLVEMKLIEDELPREKIEKSMTVTQLHEYVAERLTRKRRQDMIDNGAMEEDDMPVKHVDATGFRIWKFDDNSYKDDHGHGHLQRFRPTTLLTPIEDGRDKTLEHCFDVDRNLLFIEGPDKPLEPYNTNEEMLMFVKYYNATSQELSLVGYIIMHYHTPLQAYASQCRDLAKLPFNVPIRFYEECSPDRINPLTAETNMSAEGNLRDVSDGGIVIFEECHVTSDSNNAKVYLENLYNRIDVEIMMNTENFSFGSPEAAEPNFNSQVFLNWSCEQLSDHIGKQVNYDPEMILLWRMSPFNERATQYINIDQFRTHRVRELLGLTGQQMHDPRRHKRYRLAYTKMPIKVTEIEKRRTMKIQLMDEKMNIQEITIFPEKNGHVHHILEEARREFKFSPNGSGKLRLLHVGQSQHSMRVFQIFSESTTVLEVVQKSMTPAMYSVRVEEVPLDQVIIKANEYLLPIAHYDKDPQRMFGVPFYFKVTNDELLQSVRDRLQAKLEVGDKEFEKYKFALVSNNRIVKHLDMDSMARVNLAELGHSHVSLSQSPYLGIDHMNKSRGSRSSHATEKAIIIHN